MQETTETWAGIEGFPLYQISNMGRVKSLKRDIILSTFLAKRTGYLQVELNGIRMSVHRLVGMAFCPGYFEGAWIDHLNAVRTDNRASNLEWVTPGENSLRSFRMGRKPTYLGKFSAEHATSKPVIATNMETGEETRFECGMDAVRQGYQSSCITRSCRGEAAYHKGHYWRYA